jgi:fumarate reductase subunit D
MFISGLTLLQFYVGIALPLGALPGQELRLNWRLFMNTCFEIEYKVVLMLLIIQLMFSGAFAVI